MKSRTAMIFCVGRELLEGSVLDRNANFLASHLTQLGFRVRGIQVLDDVEDEVVPAFRQALALEPGYVFTTGGMGPGLYDITRQCAAKAAGVPLVLHPEAKEFLAMSYRRLVAKGVVDRAELNEERLAMARLPEGAKAFENAIGTAPGVRFAAGKSVWFMLPGQPEELRRMFTEHVQPELLAAGPGGYRELTHIEYAGGDESVISRMLGDLARRHPNVHSRARLQATDEALTIRIILSVEGTDQETLRKSLQAAAADLRARLGLEVAKGDRGVEGTR